MVEFFPLSDLRDPVGFLKGARVPLHDTSRHPMRREWCVDTCLLRLVSDCAWSECALPLHLFLNLSDPDVARWCDRKIAHADGRCGTIFSQPNIAELRCGFDGDDDIFYIADGTDDGFTLRHPCLSGIPRDAAHIPTARAALLRALFGRNP